MIPSTSVLFGKNVPKKPVRVILAASIFAAVSSSAFAANLTWDSTVSNSVIDTGNGTWNTTTSNTVWSSDSGATNVAWADGSNAVFTGDLTSPAAQTITLGTSINAASLRSDSSNGNSTTINGAAGLTLTAGGLSDVAGTDLYGQNLTYAMSGAASNFTLGADASWAVAAGKAVKLTGTSASNAIDLAGHTLTIGSNNTSTSLYDFNGPDIKSSVGTGQIALSGGTLRFSGSSGKTVKSESSVNMTVNSGGTLLLGVNSASTSTYAHTTSLNGGIFAVQGGNNQPVQNTGTISVDADSKLSFSTGPLGNPTNAGVLFNLSGAISGTKNLTIDNSAGAGVNVVLSNANTGFSGNWIVNNGSILQVGGAHTAGSANNNAGAVGGLGSGTVSLASGTALNFNLTAANTTNNAISGAGSVSLLSTNTAQITVGGTNNYSGGTTINSGTLISGSASALGTGNVSVSGGTLQIGSGAANLLNLGASANLLTSTGAVLKLGLNTSEIVMGSTGTFTLANDTKLDITSLALATTPGSYILIDGTAAGSAVGTWNPSTDLIGGNASFTYSFGYDTANMDAVLTVQAVPEPGAIVSLIGGMGMLIGLRRRRSA